MKGRILILGLDSAAYDVISELMHAGELPNFSRISHEGVFAEMTSTYPPRTAPAWVTLITGQNPGRHGILDFWFKKIDGYDTIIKSLVSSANYAGNTFFDILSRNKRRVGALFVPMTFPTWSVNGVMIAGPPLAPDDHAKMSFPSGIHMKLGVAHDVHLYPPSIKKGIDRTETIRDLFLMDEKRTEVALKLWDSGEYDCIMFVLESIDFVQHCLWRYFRSNEANDFKDTIPSFYRKADSLVGEIINKLNENDTLFIVSDHGMTAHPHVLFNTNAWLATKGLLSFSKRKAILSRLVYNGRNLTHMMLPERVYEKLKKKIKGSERGSAKKIRMSDQSTIAIDWENTTAYRVQMPDPLLEGIMINVKGRQPLGMVPEESINEVISLIKGELLKLRTPDNKSSFIKGVYTKEDIYHGPEMEQMPDMMIEFADGYKGGSGIMTGKFGQTPMTDILRLSGTHSMRGIFMAYGKTFKNSREIRNINIVDFAPMLLYSMNQTVPTYMDGKVHMECFNEKFIEENKLDTCDTALIRDNNEITYTKEETLQMEEKLKGLGYL